MKVNGIVILGITTTLISFAVVWGLVINNLGREILDLLGSPGFQRTLELVITLVWIVVRFR